MTPSLKRWLFMVLFHLFVFAYFSLPYLTLPAGMVRDVVNLVNQNTNFFFLIAVFMVLAFIITTLAHYGCRGIQKIIFQQNRIGEVFVSMGLITQDELAAAVSTRKLKIGEIMLKRVLMRENMKDSVPAYLKNNYAKMGEMLLKIGFSADDEIQWALNQKKKKEALRMCLSRKEFSRCVPS